MQWSHQLWMRLQMLFRRNRFTEQLSDEVRFHLDEQIAENIAAGMSPEDARYAAMRLFGNSTWLKEETRATWGWLWVEQVCQDLRYGLRVLLRNPLFSAVAVATLALGIGANTAMFSLLDQVVLRLLPVSHPEQLVIVAPVALPADLTPVVINSGDAISFTTLPLGPGEIAVVHYLRLSRIDPALGSTQ